MEERLTAGKGRPIQKRATAARGWTKRKRTRFLTVLADSCNVTKAAAAAGNGKTLRAFAPSREPILIVARRRWEL